MEPINNTIAIKDTDINFTIKKYSENDKVVALAGNPNVGKSTVFNELTGMKQHTGNWPGKTVSNAQGICGFNNQSYILVDIPGTYSLMAHSREEEVARDFICFGNPDGVIVVCDATCLERNLNLALQTIEITDNVIVCINLMDEAKKKNITIDLNRLSELLGVPVVGISARKKKGLDNMMKNVEQTLEEKKDKKTIRIKYLKPIESAAAEIEPIIAKKLKNTAINTRWAALRLLERDESLIKKINEYAGVDLTQDPEVTEGLQRAWDILAEEDITSEKMRDSIVSSIVLTAEGICNESVVFEDKEYNVRDRKIDKILTSKITGIPIMLLMLALIFWITITGANYPSEWLSVLSSWIEERLVEFCVWSGVPSIIYEPLIYGIFRVLAWVVSVMLPPMAIFFPLFTLLEDLGYLPRIAFNLDKTFKKCCACGKQALTMRIAKFKALKKSKPIAVLFLLFALII